MILTEVFDDLSDPIIILTQEGEVSYHNAAAKSLIQGETVDTLNIGPLQRLFRELEHRELTMPLSFQFSIDSEQRYQAKINHLYSAYIVHCRRVESLHKTEQLRRNTINMLHHILTSPLEHFEGAMEEMLAKLAQKQLVDAADKAQFNALIQHSQQLSARISQVQSLGELYLDNGMQDYELVAVNQLLQMIARQQETKGKQNQQIVIHSDSEDSLYCNISWMLSAMTGCVEKLLADAETDQVLEIRHTTNKYFHHIVMSLKDRGEIDVGDALSNSNEINYRGYELVDVMELDTLIAGHVIEMHGGQLRFSTHEGQELLLDIPFNGQKSSEDVQRQVKLYAKDLAEMTARTQARSSVTALKS